jgi:hypothetical protein
LLRRLDPTDLALLRRVNGGFRVAVEASSDLPRAGVSEEVWAFAIRVRKVRKIGQCDKRGRLAGRQMLDARIPNVQAPAPHDARREPVQRRA